MRIIFLALLWSIVVARENPFFPVNDSYSLNYTTNKIETLPPFDHVSTTLPPTARVLESVTIEYKNLDGSISKQKIQIEKKIDWHQPIYITQQPQQKEEKNKIHTHTQKKKKKIRYKKVGKLRFISFYVSQYSIKIKTSDKLLRHFILIKPDRIVVDFKRDLDFRTKSFFLKQGVFKKITIGNHDGYYRVVIRLDGKYIYKIKKENGSYIITLS